MISVRKEGEGDIEAIEKVTMAAFENHPVSQQTEQFIIQALRASNALTLSLVAENDCRIVGHIAFSPVTISDGATNWYGIGPLSVEPAFQRKGIGKSLMRAGMDLIKDMGGRGCVLVGDPDYYKQFGFHNIPELIYEGIPQNFFLAFSFSETTPTGVVAFHEGFLARGQHVTVHPA